MIRKTFVFFALLSVSLVVSGRNDTIHRMGNARVYFVRENDTIGTSGTCLAHSIRSVDKMDMDTATIEIRSNGEGWLDGDSIPSGFWKFYATDSSGRKYLFKEGNYLKSARSMFVFSGDTAELIKLYGRMADSICLLQLTYIPFVKSGEWSYFHGNGKLWKKVAFRGAEIPVQFVIAEINGGEQVLFPVNNDEPIEGKVEEFTTSGKLFKELYYMGFHTVYKKVTIDHNGHKTVQEFFNGQGDILPTNY